MDSNLISLRAKNLHALLASTRQADRSIRDLINDDIDSAEEFDFHELSENAIHTRKVVRLVEKLIIDELQFDVDGLLRSELEKLLLIDSLKYSKSELQFLLKKTIQTKKQVK
jgi:hypothetical protein